MKNYLKVKNIFVKELDELTSRGGFSLADKTFYQIHTLLIPKIYNYGVIHSMVSIFTLSKQPQFNGDSLTLLKFLKKLEELNKYFHYKNSSNKNSIINEVSFQDFINDEKLKKIFDEEHDVSRMEDFTYSETMNNYLLLEEYNSPLLELYEKVKPRFFDSSPIIFHENFISESLTFEEEYLHNYKDKVLEDLKNTKEEFVTSMYLKKHFYPNVPKEDFEEFHFLSKSSMSFQWVREINLVDEPFYFGNLFNIDYYFWKYSQKYSKEHLIKLIKDFNNSNFTFGMFMASSYSERKNLAEELLSTDKPLTGWLT